MSQVEMDGEPPAQPHGRPNHAVAPGGHQGGTAGLVTRSAAGVLDLLVTLLAVGAIYLGAAGLKFLWDPRGFRFPAPSLALTIVVGSWVAAVYFTASWLTTGRTYGDYVLGLRVVARDGHRMRPGLSALRAVACVVCPIGLLWVAVSPGNRSLQDVLLRTRVVYDWSDELP